MCRTAVRLVFGILAVLSTNASFAAESPSTTPKKTYSADDPVVKLALRFKKAGIGVFVCDEQGRFRYGEEGRLVAAISLSMGRATTVDTPSDTRWSGCAV